MLNKVAKRPHLDEVKGTQQDAMLDRTSNSPI